MVQPSPPPEGVKPNFDNPPNQDAMAMAVVGHCFALVTIFTLARVYTRVFILKMVYLEDCELLALCTVMVRPC
jgi:hypothetical protein